jgi:hypothetical protein
MLLYVLFVTDNFNFMILLPFQMAWRIWKTHSLKQVSLDENITEDIPQLSAEENRVLIENFSMEEVGSRCYFSDGT